ncbi:MAG: adenosine kinase [Candidatus Kapaibacterium sp.]|jgi:sugar/nucleoside kinase (ribokinase family)
MKDIELCGLGNALVDLQFQVSENELINHGIEKGSMVLIDIDKRNDLLNKFNFKIFNKVSGGSAANTVISFAQLGGKAAYKTVLGNDELGEFYTEEFQKFGIILNAEKNNNAPTGVCIVFITPDSERTMYTCLAATADFDETNIDESLIARSEYLYIEGYKFSEQRSTQAIFKAVDIAVKHGTKISLTFSDKFITDLFRDNLTKVVEKSHLVFCNDLEAKSFTGSNDDNEAFNKLCSMARNVVVTYGKRGSKVFWEGNVYDIPAYQINAVDTTGAGDSYAGAYLYGIIKTGNPKIAANLASYISSEIVAQMGPRAIFDMEAARDKIFNEFNDK